MSTSPQNVKSSRFRRAVRVALAERNWTQATLAHRVGRTRQTVNRTLNRGEFPGVRSRIAAVLGIPV